MLEEMERDERVFVLGEDVGHLRRRLQGDRGLPRALRPDARDRHADLASRPSSARPIGAALMGMRPIAEMQFIDFISCAFDQIVNFAAKSRYRWGAGVPIVVRGPCGGGVHGGPFHSQNPESYFLNVPGLKIVAPATADDAKGLIKAAIRDPDPGALPRAQVPLPAHQGRAARGRLVVPIGKARLAPRGRRRVDHHLRRRWCTWRSRRPRRRSATASTSRCSTCARSCRSTRRRSWPRRRRPARSSCCTKPRAPAGRAARSRRASPRGVRVPRRARRARRAAGHAGALQPAARGVLPAQRREASARAIRALHELLSESRRPMTDVIMPQMGESIAEGPSPSGSRRSATRSSATSRSSRSRPTRSTRRSRRRPRACSPRSWSSRARPCRSTRSSASIAPRARRRERGAAAAPPRLAAAAAARRRRRAAGARAGAPAAGARARAGSRPPPRRRRSAGRRAPARAPAAPAHRARADSAASAGEAARRDRSRRAAPDALVAGRAQDRGRARRRHLPRSPGTGISGPRDQERHPRPTSRAAGASRGTAGAAAPARSAPPAPAARPAPRRRPAPAVPVVPAYQPGTSASRSSPMTRSAGRSPSTW